MLDTPEISLVEYGVSLQNGFLPEVLPLRRLEDPYYSRWEDIVQDLPALIQAGTIRQAVIDLPILSTENLQEKEPEWRRAYVVLAYLTHAYVWGGEKPEDVILPFDFSLPVFCTPRSPFPFLGGPDFADIRLYRGYRPV